MRASGRRGLPRNLYLAWASPEGMQRQDQDLPTKSPNDGRIQWIVSVAFAELTERIEIPQSCHVARRAELEQTPPAEENERGRVKERTELMVEAQLPSDTC
jgi:hypothetical protein